MVHRSLPYKSSSNETLHDPVLHISCGMGCGNEGLNSITHSTDDMLSPSQKMSKKKKRGKPLLLFTRYHQNSSSTYGHHILQNPFHTLYYTL